MPMVVVRLLREAAVVLSRQRVPQGAVEVARTLQHGSQAQELVAQLLHRTMRIDALPRLEQSLRFGLNRRLLRAQQFDQAIIHPRGFDPETHETANALGRADRRPALGRITLTQADEQVTRKQRLIRNA